MPKRVDDRTAHRPSPPPRSSLGLLDLAGVDQRPGNGLAGYGNRVWLAHRLAWTGRHGPIPAGKILCHRCDERRCVNPDHPLTISTTCQGIRCRRER
jgi:hypothetical protein